MAIGKNKYHKKAYCNDECIHLSIHAEIDALFKLDNRYIKGLDIFIIRVNEKSYLKNSRPCNTCIEILKRKGIRKAYYSNEDGEIVYEFIENMPKIHESSGGIMRKYINSIN
jgi:deoxycytidylate deaminase